MKKLLEKDGKRKVYERVMIEYGVETTNYSSFIENLVGVYKVFKQGYEKNNKNSILKGSII